MSVSIRPEHRPHRTRAMAIPSSPWRVGFAVSIAPSTGSSTAPSTTPSTALAALLTGLLIGLFASVGVASAALAPSAWPMFHRNLSHTGQTTDAIPATGSLAWSMASGDTIEFSSPVIGVDGTIYVGNQGKDLVALYPSGHEKWRFHTLGNIRYSTPAIGDDGTIYVGSADNKLYAVNANGTLKWAATTGGAVKTSPAIAPDGTIYAGSDDRKMWAFFPNGATKWSYATGDSVRSSPVVAADGAVIFGSNDGFLYVLEATGVLRYRIATGGAIRSSVALGQGGDIIFGSADGFLYAIGNTGALQWATFTNNNLRSSPSIGASGKIYLGVDQDLNAYHDDGTLAWNYATGGRIFSSPAVRTNLDNTETVLVGSDDGRLIAVTNGTLLWSTNVLSPVRSSPAIGNQHVYFGAMNGFMYAVGAPVVDVIPSADRALALVASPNPMRGDQVWFHLTGAGIGSNAGAGAFNPAVGIDGLLTLLDATGRELRQLPLTPGGPAVWDGRDAAGRALPGGVFMYRWTVGHDSGSGRLVRLR